MALLQRAGARAVIFGNGADQQESVIKVLTPYTVPFAATIPTQTVLPYLAKLFTSALEGGTNVSVRTATLHQGTGEQFFAPPYTLLDDTILVVGPLPTGGAPPTVVRPVRLGRATFNPATLNEDGWVGMPLVEATLDRRCAADNRECEACSYLDTPFVNASALAGAVALLRSPEGGACFNSYYYLRAAAADADAAALLLIARDDVTYNLIAPSVPHTNHSADAHVPLFVVARSDGDALLAAITDGGGVSIPAKLPTIIDGVAPSFDAVAAALGDGLYSQPTFAAFETAAAGATAADADGSGGGGGLAHLTQLQILSPKSARGHVEAGQALFNPQPHPSVTAPAVRVPLAVDCQVEKTCFRCHEFPSPFAHPYAPAPHNEGVPPAPPPSTPPVDGADASSSSAAALPLAGRIAIIDLAQDACFHLPAYFTYFAQAAGAVGVVLVNSDDALNTLTQRALPFDATVPTFNVIASDGARLQSDVPPEKTAADDKLPAKATLSGDAPAADAAFGLTLRLPAITSYLGGGGGGDGGGGGPLLEAAESLGGERTEAAEAGGEDDGGAGAGGRAREAAVSNLNVTARVEAPAGLTSEQIAALGGGGAAVLAVLLVLLLGLMVVVRRRRMPMVNTVDQGVQADELLANVPHRSHSFTSIYGSGRLASDVGAAARRTRSTRAPRARACCGARGRAAASASATRHRRRRAARSARLAAIRSPRAAAAMGRRARRLVTLRAAAAGCVGGRYVLRGCELMDN